MRPAAIFIAVLSASNSTYAEATWSQQVPDWIGSHVRAFDDLGGVIEVLVFNYVAGNIIGECFAKHFAEFARHYGVAVMSARVRHPRDNAYVESFNGQLRDECLNEHWFASMMQARAVIEEWRRDYNE